MSTDENAGTPHNTPDTTNASNPGHSISSILATSPARNAIRTSPRVNISNYHMPNNSSPSSSSSSTLLSNKESQKLGNMSGKGDNTAANNSTSIFSFTEDCNFQGKDYM